jgi:uncharacterized membrane protein SirB2
VATLHPYRPFEAASERFSRAQASEENNMIKIVHLLFVLLTLASFVGRVVLAETRPSLLKKMRFRIVPPIIDTFLLLSGIALVFQGQWWPGDHHWLVAKLTALLGYIIFGVITMRIRGTVRWLAFTGAMICFAYIGIVAVTKNPLFFL